MVWFSRFSSTGKLIDTQNFALIELKMKSEVKYSTPFIADP
jgi:hypothetical protein